jgi:hypothetical protein
MYTVHTIYMNTGEIRSTNFYTRVAYVTIVIHRLVISLFIYLDYRIDGRVQSHIVYDYESPRLISILIGWFAKKPVRAFRITDGEPVYCCTTHVHTCCYSRREPRTGSRTGNPSSVSLA